MARQRAFTNSELLDATEQLIMERGYDGFHLKALAQLLKGARSTIYEYYANKEEIVAACMRRCMEQTLSACEGLDQYDSVEAIRRMMTIFMERASFHQLMQAAPKVDQTVSERAKADLLALEEGHAVLKEKLLQLFARALEEGHLRPDIPLPVITAVFFHAIETPNWLNLPADKWTDLLFKLWWNGGGQNRN